MAFAVTGYKAWALEHTKAVSPGFTQKFSMTITGTNADIAYDFGTTGGTFWTSAEAHVTYGAIATLAKAMLYALCGKALHPYELDGTFTGAYCKGATVAATVYTELSGTVTNSRDIAFNAGNAPTSATVEFSWKLNSGELPVNY